MFYRSANDEEIIGMIYSLTQTAKYMIKNFKTYPIKMKLSIITIILASFILTSSVAYGIVWAFKHDLSQPHASYKEPESPFEVLSKSRLNGADVILIQYKESGCRYVVTQSIDVALHDRTDSMTPYLNKDGLPDCSK